MQSTGHGVKSWQLASLVCVTLCACTCIEAEAYRHHSVCCITGPSGSGGSY